MKRLRWLILGCWASTAVWAQDVARLCIDHHPPNHMFPLEMGARWQLQKEPFGAAILQMEELAERLGLRLVVSANTPFNRCLAQMRDGSADLMWGLLDTDDRATYMHLISFRPSTPKGFYHLKSRNLHISKLDDLRGLRVGVALGFRYFDAFDDARNLFHRVEAPSNPKLFELLLRDRIDVVVMTEYQAEDLLTRHPAWKQEIVQADLRGQSDSPSHIALSKKSPLAARVDEFRQAVDDMVREDRFNKIREAFNEWYQGQLDNANP